MIYTNVDIKDLIPMEGFLAMKVVREYLKQGETNRSIPLIPYNGKCLVCDGHHGTTAKLIKNKRQISAQILERDEDITSELKGVFSKGKYSSIESVIGDYEEFWKPRLKKRRISSFQDYIRIYAKTIARLNFGIRAQ